MEKIKMTTPLVEMDGDEMTRILWKMIKENPSLTVMINDDGTLKVDYSDDDDYYTFHCVKSDSE